MVVVRAPIIGCLLAGAGISHASPTLQWLDKELFQRITLTGRRVIGFHMQSVEGDQEAFNSLTYYGQGGRRFTDDGQMSIVGQKVSGILNFNMQLSDNRYQDPQARKIWL